MDQTTITDGSITIGGAQPVAAGTTTATVATTAPVTPPAAQTTATDPVGLFDKFEIPDMVKRTYPDLVPLILETESMNDDERQYWFQILPIMTDDQVVKLREILTNEKNQLAEIDKQYNREVKQINEQHVSEWKEFERKDKREQLIQKEKKTEEEEAKAQEELLNQLNNI